MTYYKLTSDNATHYCEDLPYLNDTIVISFGNNGKTHSNCLKTKTVQSIYPYNTKEEITQEQWEEAKKRILK